MITSADVLWRRKVLGGLIDALDALGRCANEAERGGDPRVGLVRELEGGVVQLTKEFCLELGYLDDAQTLAARDENE